MISITMIFQKKLMTTAKYEQPNNMFSEDVNKV